MGGKLIRRREFERDSEQRGWFSEAVVLEWLEPNDFNDPATVHGVVFALVVLSELSARALAPAAWRFGLRRRFRLRRAGRGRKRLEDDVRMSADPYAASCNVA